MSQNEQQPSFELPPVQADVAGAAMETPVASPERSMQPSAPAPIGGVHQLPAQPLPGQPLSQVPVDDHSATASQYGAPQVASDSDLIEKEWVVKAKQIVAATKEDPYVQNQELSKFKADYLKKRYNKDVKIDGV